MTSMKTISGCILGALLASTSVAMADEVAIVNKVDGKNVTWQRGDARSVVRVQTLLNAGDTIAAGKGSSVEVQFIADNCTIRVNAGGSLAIGDASPCSAATKTKADASQPADGKVVKAAAQSVEVLDTKGPVTRVNKGEGMIAAAAGDSLKRGDAVFAGKNSSVSLYFASAKCSYTVKSSSVYTITDKAPCRASGVDVVPTADVPSEPSEPKAAAVIPPAVMIGAGAVVVGGAVAIIVTSQDDNNNNGPGPITPQ